MGDTKIFSLPETGGRAFGGGSAMEGAMLGSMMGNGGMGGANGMWNNPWWALIFLAAFRGNGGLFGNDGNGSGGSQARFDALQEQLSTIQGQNALLAAIQGGTNEVKSLASTIGCDFNAVQGAINAVQSAICQLGNNIGLGQRDIVAAVTNGDRDIINQMCNCCCGIKELITAQGYQNQLATCNQTNALINAANANTLSLRDGATANTNAILAKLDAAEMRAMQDKLDALRERNSTLVAQLSNEHQTAAIQAYQAQAIAPVNAALGDLSTRLAKIECAMPPTFPMPYAPAAGNYIPVNYSVPVNPLAAAPQCGC